MSDGSGRVMHTDLADLGITVVEKPNQLSLSVPIGSCECKWAYFFELCGHDGTITFYVKKGEDVCPCMADRAEA